jgi:hypothetical protein
LQLSTLLKPGSLAHRDHLIGFRQLKALLYANRWQLYRPVHAETEVAAAKLGLVTEGEVIVLG